MPQFTFDPPLPLKGNIVVQNLDDAVRFMVGYQEARRPALHRSVLHRLEEQSAKQKSGTPVMHFAAGPRWSGSSTNLTSDQ